ncbi:MAG: RNA polymerase sigma factor [Solirubrobacteraceae bacterium]
MRRLEPESLGEHLDALYRAAWALCGSREDAEDLVQDTFARVLARPRLVRGDERAYLMRALRNTFYSRLRTASRRPQTAATLDEIQAPDPRVTQRPDQAIEMAELVQTISTLPEDFRLALVAVDVLGLSYAEAARALGTLEATITTRVYRARQRLVRALSAPAPTGPAHTKERDLREGSELERRLTATDVTR